MKKVIVFIIISISLISCKFIATKGLSYLEACNRQDEIAFNAIKYYVEHNKADAEGLLIAAEHNGNEQIVKELLLSSLITKDERVSAFWKSLDNTNPEVCRMFIEDGIDKRIISNAFWESLEKNKPEICKILSASGIDINARNNKGKTPLIIACEKKYTDIVAVLIDAGAEANIKDEKGETLLQKECSKNNANSDTEKIIYELIRGGADAESINSKGESLLFVTCSKNKLGTINVINGLIKGGANVNAKNSNGETPLMIACLIDNMGVINTLIKAGADVNAQNVRGETPLIIACRSGNLGAVQVLLDNGADVGIKNKKGETPIIAAKNSKKNNIIRYFDNLNATKLAKEKAEAEAKARAEKEKAEAEIKKKCANYIMNQMVYIPREEIEMLSTEVTQYMFKTIMGKNPSKFIGDKNPVENVSWIDAIIFCNRLSNICGLTPVYSGRDADVSVNSSANGFRLPTVHEWVAAAEGGDSYLYAGGDSLNDVAWHYENSNYKTHPVAQKKPNGYGLYDMSGNVNEWCFNESSNRPPQYRSYLGGGFDSFGPQCEIASRREDKDTVSFWVRPYTEKDDELGFRIVRNIK